MGVLEGISKELQGLPSDFGLEFLSRPIERSQEESR
jgi:hypothetical protein